MKNTMIERREGKKKKEIIKFPHFKYFTVYLCIVARPREMYTKNRLQMTFIQFEYAAI